MVDLVLVNPNAKNPAPFSAVEPPLWLSLVAGYNIAQDKVVRIIDAEALNLSVEQTIHEINKTHPKEVLIVAQGKNPSVSSTPKMFVTEELLKYLPEAKVTGIHPIAINHPKCIREPFKGFPYVPWDLLPMERYRSHNWHSLKDIEHRSPYGVLYTSLGCPFSCEYCNIHTLYSDHKVLYRPMYDIFVDLDYFACKGIKNIKIWDELFCLDRKRVEEICDFIISEGYSFNIWAYARVDTVSGPMLRKMKRAGINWLAYGFESSSEDIRKLAGKKFEDSQVRYAIDSTRSAGISIIGNFIFGLPGDTMSSMRANLDMAIKENFEYVNFYVALPYPGSQWYDSLESKPADPSSFSQFSKSICADPEVVRFRDYAFNVYFNRPEYLAMIKRKFGHKAGKHIKEMLKWSIRT